VVKILIKSFNQLFEAVKKNGYKKIAVACADDEEILKAISNVSEQGLTEGIFIGNRGKIEELIQKKNLDIKKYEIIDSKDSKSSAECAVRLVAEGHADLVMKGLINTADFLKAVLNEEYGLTTGNLLSHVAVFEIKNYHKFLIITDAAMNISPDAEQKVNIINNALTVTRALNIQEPKVALLAAVEKINTKMSATLDAAYISKMAERKQIKGAIIDGPLALDNAVSAKAAAHKGIASSVAGDADILVVPNIETGNVLYKSLVCFAEARCAGIIAGAKVPVVVTSRADSWETKMNSIALGLLMAQK